jgi:hypothetical protein
MKTIKRKPPVRESQPEKKSELLTNKTSVYYTVHLSNEYLVSHYDYPSEQISVSPKQSREPKIFFDLAFAKDAARIINGKIIKHTSHTIETEETEEVTINE